MPVAGLISIPHGRPACGSAEIGAMLRGLPRGSVGGAGGGPMRGSVGGATVGATRGSAARVSSTDGGAAVGTCDEDPGVRTEGVRAGGGAGGGTAGGRGATGADGGGLLDGMPGAAGGPVITEGVRGGGGAGGRPTGPAGAGAPDGGAVRTCASTGPAVNARRAIPVTARAVAVMRHLPVMRHLLDPTGSKVGADDRGRCRTYRTINGRAAPGGSRRRPRCRGRRRWQGPRDRRSRARPAWRQARGWPARRSRSAA